MKFSQQFCPRLQVYTLCCHIGLLFDKRLDTILLGHRIRKYPDSPSTRYRIRCGFIFFQSGERIQRYPDSLPNSPDACGRKPYPERKSCDFKKISGYVWTGPKSHPINYFHLNCDFLFSFQKPEYPSRRAAFEEIIGKEKVTVIDA